jgi:exodeoxyribonuclease-5
MEFTRQQEEALNAVQDWMHAGETSWFYLGGYAGTGKTTLAQYLADKVGNPVYGAYTGKAAQVMRSKGCLGATTIHRLIYRVEDLHVQLLFKQDSLMRAESQGRHHLVHVLMEEIATIKEEMKKKGNKPSFSLLEKSALASADMLILDECSMISEEMATDILSFGVPVLVLGDPAQLPPINGLGYFTMRNPDYMLTEVCRQAKDNPILDMATRIRMGERLKLGNYGDSKIIKASEFDQDEVLNAGIMLTGKNVTRLEMNAMFRNMLGRNHRYPVKGDRLISGDNLHDYGIYNGSTFSALRDAEQFASTGRRTDLAIQAMMDDTNEAKEVKSSTVRFDKYEEGDSEDPRYKMAKLKRKIIDADYAYCLTVHKSQGSQWDHVIILDDGFLRWRGKEKERRAWMYTAITRAAKTVTIGRQ